MCRYALRLIGSFLVCLAVAAPSVAQKPGTDIKSRASADLSSRMTFGGTWTPVDASATLSGASFIGPFWNVIKTGAEQREGVVFGGWQYNGSFTTTLTDSVPTRAGILEQQPDGSLREATAQLFGLSTTGGIGSVMVADFNGDGRDDVLLPAHNESPTVWKSSVAFMSRPDGLFTRVDVGDAAANHDARVVTLNGTKKVIARSFSSGNLGAGSPAYNSIYSWNGTNFTQTMLQNLGGMSVNAGAFAGDDSTWIVIGDSTAGPGIPVSNYLLPYAFKLNSSTNRVVTPPVSLPKPYFNDKPEYAGFVSEWDPYSKTHTPRILSTDLNQDGLVDLVPVSTLWHNAEDGHQKSAVQLLLNHGNMQFTDDTDALALEYQHDSVIDYSLRLADVDGSGIDTFLAASFISYPAAKDAIRQGNYVLVNDGTGRLYAAMHDEFRAMGPQVIQFLRGRLPSGMSVGDGLTPQFIAYRTPDGALNFVAAVRVSNSGTTAKSWAFVSLDLRINLATDFQRDLTISSRNGSKRIRTFAGNDTISRALADPDCRIDGGLGTNVVIYPGPRASWSISKANGAVTVKPVSGSGGTDTLVRIQIARFADGDVSLTN